MISKIAPQPQWYVVYCASRTEKKTQQLLTKIGIDSYVPLITELHQWSDRKKKVEVPLLKGYVFVHITSNQFTQVRMVSSVVNFVQHNQQPAIVKPSEIEALQRLVSSGSLFQIQEHQFMAGDRVVVREGPLNGLEGVWIKKAKSHKFIIQLEAINQMILVEIPASSVQVLGKSAG